MGFLWFSRTAVDPKKQGSGGCCCCCFGFLLFATSIYNRYMYTQSCLLPGVRFPPKSSSLPSLPLRNYSFLTFLLTALLPPPSLSLPSPFLGSSESEKKGKGWIYCSVFIAAWLLLLGSVQLIIFSSILRKTSLGVFCSVLPRDLDSWFLPSLPGPCMKMLSLWDFPLSCSIIFLLPISYQQLPCTLT